MKIRQINQGVYIRKGNCKLEHMIQSWLNNEMPVYCFSNNKKGTSFLTFEQSVQNLK